MHDMIEVDIANPLEGACATCGTLVFMRDFLDDSEYWEWLATGICGVCQEVT